MTTKNGHPVTHGHDHDHDQATLCSLLYSMLVVLMSPYGSIYLRNTFDPILAIINSDTNDAIEPWISAKRIEALYVQAAVSPSL